MGESKDSPMKFLIIIAAFAAANARLSKIKGFVQNNEIAALSCENGKDDLADGQEVTIETPNYPENYPNKAKCNWKIKVPANEEVHIWCETFDLVRKDFLRVLGVTSKLYGSFPDGFGEILPASNVKRTLKFQFRSNKKKNAGGFRCQIAAVAPTTGSGSGSTTGSGSGASCLTNDGPAAGSACAFPFNYMNVSHSACTTIDGDAKPWCVTQTDASGDMAVGGAWGYCDASCPLQETGTSPGTCQCGVKGGAANGRIVGGQETEEHEYPWQVGLVRRNGRTPFCGGTLISSTHVLTAAHCTDDFKASRIRVLLGEHSIADSVYNRVDVAEIINHPDWDSPTIDNDYAILRLAKPVTFTNKVAPACLPADTAATYAGVVATVTGWGRLIHEGNQPTTLQEVDLTVTTKTACENAYGGHDITDNMICAAASGKSSCNGDSGGPLIAPENGRQALIGVVSFGVSCATDFYPSVFARVTEKMSWILANTAGTFSSTCAALN